MLGRGPRFSRRGRRVKRKGGLPRISRTRTSWEPLPTVSWDDSYYTFTASVREAVLHLPFSCGWSECCRCQWSPAQLRRVLLQRHPLWRTRGGRQRGRTTTAGEAGNRDKKGQSQSSSLVMCPQMCGHYTGTRESRDSYSMSAHDRPCLLLLPDSSHRASPHGRLNQAGAQGQEVQPGRRQPVVQYCAKQAPASTALQQLRMPKQVVSALTHREHRHNHDIIMTYCRCSAAYRAGPGPTHTLHSALGH